MSDLKYMVVFLMGIVSVIASIQDAYVRHGVVPDVIYRPPRSQLYARFPWGKEVNYGNKLTPSQASQPPIVSWQTSIGTGPLYTIVMLDPDAPSRANPTKRNWLHWLVGNVPGKDVARGEILAGYNGPAPPKASGLHRYVLLVFQQNGRLSFNENYLDNSPSRGGFNLNNFVANYELGEPIAGNFFFSYHTG
ncbi:protein D3-like [Pectinophora gossypiella]|uniref:protein D3-like n=1 Tax=Pectinophora gossypiella TaxID=13191 RepID=UPI00214E04B0|nr:protein D3-like [Pectinophora gossypiella]